MSLMDCLSRTCPTPSGSRKTTTGTESHKFSKTTGSSSVAAPGLKGLRDTTLKAVTINDGTISSARADIHSPLGQTFSGRDTSAGPKEKKPYPSSGRGSGDQRLQHTSSPKLSDVGSDREADNSLDLSKMFGSLYSASFISIVILFSDLFFVKHFYVFHSF